MNRKLDVTEERIADSTISSGDISDLDTERKRPMLFKVLCTERKRTKKKIPKNQVHFCLNDQFTPTVM